MDCHITGVVERKLNQDDTSTDSDTECTGVDLPEPSGEPSPKWRRKTLLDYFGKETPVRSHMRHTHSFFGGMSQQMYRVDLHIERKAVTHAEKNVQVILLMSHTNIVMETSPTIVTRNVDLTKYTASVKKYKKIVQHAHKHSEYAASMHYKVTRSAFYGWKNVDKTPAAAAKAKKRFPCSKRGKHLKKGAGRHMTYSKEIDYNLIAWALKQRDFHLPVRRLELKLKAIALIYPHLPTFKASSGWIEKFMRRHSLPLRIIM